MKESVITYIESKVQEADFKNTSEAYSAIYSELQSLDLKYPSNYILEYYKGLVCYSNPDTEENFRLKMAIKHFEKSLKINSKKIMSKVYLGYCYFDLGEYGNSQNNFKEVLSKKENWKLFEKNEQMWRVVNMTELISVCNLKMGWLTKFQDFYTTWKVLYYLHIRQDNFYFPESLVIETSNYLKVKGDTMSTENIASFRKISLDLIGIIKGGDGFEEIYSEELKNLKNWDGHSQYQPIRVYSH